MIWYYLTRFLVWLNDDNSNTQYAWGIVVGMSLGMIPVVTLHWLVLFGLAICLRINLFSLIISWIVFGAASPLFKAPIQSLGTSILSKPSLTGTWATLYHAPFFPFTQFNHSHVMGSTIAMILLIFPVYKISWFFVNRYREPVHQFWRSTRVHRAYVHYRRFSS